MSQVSAEACIRSVVTDENHVMTAPDHNYETAGDRVSLARQAGVSKLSFISVLAGVLGAYGSFGLTNDLSRNDWARLGTGSAMAAAVVLLLAYLFGGYVAGRMARRAGLLNGLAVSCSPSSSSPPSARSSPARPTPTPSAPTGGALASSLGQRMERHRSLAGIASLAAMLIGA